MTLMLSQVGLARFTPKDRGYVSIIVAAALQSYTGTALASLQLEASTRQNNPYRAHAVHAINVDLLGDWCLRIQRRTEARTWHWEQYCPRCRGGGRWTPMGKGSESHVFSCGGCGYALARPGTAVSHTVDWQEPEELPQAALSEQLEYFHYNPLEAVLEAEALIAFARRLMVAGDDVAKWSQESRLATLMAGDSSLLP